MNAFKIFIWKRLQKKVISAKQFMRKIAILTTVRGFD